MSLKIKELSKAFGEHVAVNQLTLEVEKGQVFGLLGRNGAGKSTTIKMILGLVKPTAGFITWNGQSIETSRVSIGYLPEERGLYTKSKVSTQLAYFGKLEGMSSKEADKAIDNWLERLEISEYKHKLVSDLSKGNQQKIQLIATLLHNPELVILDEPFSGLDPVNANLFAEVIREEIEKGKTVILSSHQMNLVESFCDEVCLLKKGKAVVQGSLKAIKDQYEFKDLVLDVSEEVKNELVKGEIGFVENKHEIRIKIRSESEALSILNQLLNVGVTLTQFKMLQPTLQEIFVEKVG